MNKKFAALLKSLLRTCATSATTVLVMFWGWIAVIYFSGLELILGIFGLYALALAPVVVICADPPTRWRESLGVAWMIRSTGVFLGFCLASTMLIPPFDLNNIQEFMIYIMGLTAFYIVLCAALIGPRRIFREILESDYRHRGRAIEAHSGSGADVVHEDHFDDVFEGFQEASAVEVVEDLPDLDADGGS